MSNKKESIKKRMQNGEVVFGTFFKANSPGIAEMIGYSGFDFVIVDGEHGNYSYSEMEHMVRALNLTGCEAIIRVPSSAEEHILHAADMGAQGVQVPSVVTVEEAQTAAKGMRYYPVGNRGLAINTRASHYTFYDREKCMSLANEDLLCVMHIENLEMAAKVHELCQIPEIDVLFIGPGDLSQAVGKPGQMEDPEVIAVVKKIIDDAKGGGKILGIACANENAMRRYIDWGVQFIGYLSDTVIFSNALRETQKIFVPYRK